MAVAARTRGGVASSDAVEGQQRLLGYIAHELRTPLATQRALLEVALADANAGVATWREIGEEVLSACRQQARVLDACLTLARSRHGTQWRLPVDLAAVADEALRAHDLSGLDRVVELEPVTMSGDLELLERLVANLVSNAVRHNVAGGWIEVVTRVESGRAVLSIANTGLPVPAGELSRLFQPFQRLHSHAATADGVGLGLAIVQAIAEAHDGTVVARARVGGGLRVAVAFPALD